MTSTDQNYSEQSPSPLITVILSIWNGGDFVTSAIESILNQTVRDFEFIIIDDGSTDHTRQIIEEFANLDNRIVPIFQENIGLTKSLNRGIRLAKGRYIARQDADDWSLPSRFEKQLPWLENKGYDLCCCRSINIRAQRPIPRRIWLHLPREHLLRYMNPFIHGSFMLRKSRLQALGGYDESYAYAQDYKLLFDLYSQDVPIKYLVEPLYCTRHFSTSIKLFRRQDQDQAARRVKRLFRDLRR